MTEYGLKIGKALSAVRTMYADASKLLQDCDGTIGKGRTSIYGSYVTSGLTYHVRAKHYMAEALFRLYDAGEGVAGLVEGVSIYFLDQKDRAAEPILIVGQVKYHIEQEATIKSVSGEWDLWYAYFDGCESQAFDEVLAPEPNDTGRIEWVKVIAVPLYSVANMDVVVDLMNKVRQHNE
jgi:hypothetical protein